MFQQVCTSSKILSVTLAQSTTVEAPVHVDQSFTWDRAKKLCDDMEKRPIQCVWVSISDRRIDKAAIAELGSRIPAIQRRSKRQFVFAMPWHSQMWKMAWAKAEANWYGVDRIDVQAYDNPNTWTDDLGLMHNLPEWTFFSLDRVADITGPKRKRDSESDGRATSYDEYPRLLCEAICSRIHESVRSQLKRKDDWPWQNPVQTGLVDTLLEDLSKSDLKAFKNAVSIEVRDPHPNMCWNLEAVYELAPVMVFDRSVKDFMNWLNSRSMGTLLNFKSKEVWESCPCPRALTKMRKRCYPDVEFKLCWAMRGVDKHELPKVESCDMPAAVYMWKKTSRQKEIYAGTLDDIASGNFDTRSWSIVIMARPRNIDGGTPYRPSNVQPGTSPSSPTDMDTSGGGPPGGGGAPPPPPPASFPPYSDPNMTIAQLRPPPAPDQPTGRRKRSNSDDRRDPMSDQDEQMSGPGPPRPPAPPAPPGIGLPGGRERSRSRDEYTMPDRRPHGPASPENRRSLARRREVTPISPKIEPREPRSVPSSPSRPRIHTPDVRPVKPEPKSEPRPSTEYRPHRSPTAVKGSALKPPPGLCPPPKHRVKDEPSSSSSGSRGPSSVARRAPPKIEKKEEKEELKTMRSRTRKSTICSKVQGVDRPLMEPCCLRIRCNGHLEYRTMIEKSLILSMIYTCWRMPMHGVIIQMPTSGLALRVVSTLSQTAKV